jgi:hypothetical protein
VSTFRSGACLSIGYIVRRRVEFQLVKSSLFQQVQLVYVVSTANKAELMLHVVLLAVYAVTTAVIL